MTRCSAATICVVRHGPGAHGCRSHQHEELWSWLAEWIRALAGVATLYSQEMKNKHSGKEKSRLQFLMAAAMVLEQCLAPLDGGVPAGGHAGHWDMRQRGVAR